MDDTRARRAGSPVLTAPDATITPGDIEQARARLRGAIRETPCAHSEPLSELTGTRCFVKLENLQMTGSFKERGAANLLMQLPPAERARGVVAASGAAPAPSTTVFSISSRRSTAFASSSSATVTISCTISRAIANACAPTSRTAMPSAIVAAAAARVRRPAATDFTIAGSFSD